MLSARGHRRNDKPPIRCPLCSRTGHSALQFRELQITRREKKPNRYQGDGEHCSNGGGGGNGLGGGNGGGDANGGGGAAIVEVDAVNIAAGTAISKIKVAGIPNPAIRPLAPTAIPV